jgi:hypothetical protein
MSGGAGSSRVRFFWDCINPNLKYLSYGFSVLAALTWCRDELLPKEYREIHLLDILPNWPLYLWVTVFGLILVFAFGEGLYQQSLVQATHHGRKPVLDAKGREYYQPPKRNSLNAIGVPSLMIIGLALLWFVYPASQITTGAGKASNLEKETISDILIKKCPVVSAGIGRFPSRFIHAWVERINSIRVERQKLDLQAVIQKMGGPPREGPSMKELAAEATFTLRCLASEGFVRIKDTPVQGKWYGEDFDNLEFEFVSEKLDQFLKAL